MKIKEGIFNYEMILLLVKNNSMIEEKIGIDGFCAWSLRMGFWLELELVWILGNLWSFLS